MTTVTPTDRATTPDPCICEVAAKARWDATDRARAASTEALALGPFTLAGAAGGDSEVAARYIKNLGPFPPCPDP